jgi:hypothetical protein
VSLHFGEQQNPHQFLPNKKGCSLTIETKVRNKTLQGKLVPRWLGKVFDKIATFMN